MAEKDERIVRQRRPRVVRKQGLGTYANRIERVEVEIAAKQEIATILASRAEVSEIARWKLNYVAGLKLSQLQV